MPQSIFDLQINEVTTVDKEEWTDLGPIPTGTQFQVGICNFTAIDKALKVEVRTNKTGQSAGTKTKTNLLGKTGMRPGKTKKLDLYRRGKLFTITVIGTGVEHWWLRFTSKKATLGEVLSLITYTEL